MENKITLNGNEYIVTNFIQTGGQPNPIEYSLEILVENSDANKIIEDFKTLPNTLEIKQDDIVICQINGCTELRTCVFNIADNTETLTVVIREPSIMERIKKLDEMIGSVDYIEESAKLIQSLERDMKAVKTTVSELSVIKDMVSSGKVTEKEVETVTKG